jgi:hypothetical protein
MTNPQSALDDHEFMKALLDLVIPPSASGDLPGAGELSLAPAVATALQTDKMIGPLVEPGAQAVREAALSEHADGLAGMTSQAATKVLEDQLAAHPVLIMGILRYLYPAYYQHPQVLAAIGEPARPPFPEGFEVDATAPALLTSLQERRQKA